LVCPRLVCPRLVCPRLVCPRLVCPRLVCPRLVWLHTRPLRDRLLICLISVWRGRAPFDGGLATCTDYSAGESEAQLRVDRACPRAAPWALLHSFEGAWPRTSQRSPNARFRPSGQHK
jgi:hypothetical protein